MDITYNACAGQGSSSLDYGGSNVLAYRYAPQISYGFGFFSNFDTLIDSTAVWNISETGPLK